MCCIRPKCNWCNSRNNEIFRIDIYCKWQGLHICVNCYNNKIKNIGVQYPRFK